MHPRRALRRAYELMHAQRGHLGWWPGDTPFEVAVGAILTQNTAWTNVEKAIANLNKAGVLEPTKMFNLREDELAQLIRPAGYFNVKARRLRHFLRLLVEEFGASLDRLLSGETWVVRARLLAINGIGRETADSILLYAGNHQSFVIDAYTRRIFERHGWWLDQRVVGSLPAFWATRAIASPHSASAPFLVPLKSNTPETYEALKALCEISLNHRSAAARLCGGSNPCANTELSRATSGRPH